MATTKKPAGGNRTNNALQAPANLSGELEAVVGKGPMPRSQVTSKVWDYIKSNKLQSQTDKRMINPDALLGKVIGTSSISMFKMTAEVSKHIKKA